METDTETDQLDIDGLLPSDFDDVTLFDLIDFDGESPRFKIGFNPTSLGE